MIKKFWGKKPNLGKTPPSKKDEQEYGKGKEDIIMCPECHAVYYYKSWHHSLRDYDNLGAEKQVKFKLCPADRMKKNGMFEGELIIENLPSHVTEELTHLIEHVAERAYKRDPMDRILDMHIGESRIEVRTSENQLAMNLGRQVHKAQKALRGETKLSEGEDVARVRLRWEGNK